MSCSSPRINHFPQGTLTLLRIASHTKIQELGLLIDPALLLLLYFLIDKNLIYELLYVHILMTTSV